jgi:hypothetical protein
MDVTILYALFGIVIAGVPALHCLRNNRYNNKGITLSCDHDDEHDRAQGHKNCEFERAGHGP